MKRAIGFLAAALLMLLCATACADPAITDGTVTAWIGEENYFFISSTDGVTRKLSTPMSDLLAMTEEEAIGLTRENQIVAVRKDGSQYRFVESAATEESIAAWRTSPYDLVDGKLTVGEETLSEQAVAAGTDGIILYWVEQNLGSFVLKQRTLPGKELAAAGRTLASLTGQNTLAPQAMTVTADALTITSESGLVIVYTLKDGASKSFPASLQKAENACLAEGRLYTYTQNPVTGWTINDIRNQALELTTVSPEPTTTLAPTAIPTAVPTVTARVTAAPYSEDNNIYYGARGSTIRRIQQRLQKLDYPVGRVDGVYGEQTQIAVYLFYDALHLREHKYITPTMYNKLFSSRAPVYDPFLALQKGDRGLSVLYMQMALDELGYDPGKLDGIYGSQTVKAMAEYQKDIGYQPGRWEEWGEYASHDVMERLYGPEPLPTPTPTLTPSPTPAPTGTPVPTGTAQPTNTPTPTSTASPESTVSPTAVPTSTPEPTKTPDPTSTPEPTSTPKPTDPPTPEPTSTPIPSDPPTPEPTSAPEPAAPSASEPTDTGDSGETTDSGD